MLKMLLDEFILFCRRSDVHGECISSRGYLFHTYTPFHCQLEEGFDRKSARPPPRSILLFSRRMPSLAVLTRVWPNDTSTATWCSMMLCVSHHWHTGDQRPFLSLATRGGVVSPEGGGSVDTPLVGGFLCFQREAQN